MAKNKGKKDSTLVKKPLKEQLSKAELEELMGTRRPTYGRRRGALIQK